MEHAASTHKCQYFWTFPSISGEKFVLWSWSYRLISSFPAFYFMWCFITVQVSSCTHFVSVLLFSSSVLCFPPVIACSALMCFTCVWLLHLCLIVFPALPGLLKSVSSPSFLCVSLCALYSNIPSVWLCPSEFVWLWTVFMILIFAYRGLWICFIVLWTDFTLARTQRDLIIILHVYLLLLVGCYCDIYI